MMDLQELRIQRTPVTPNSKCESCVHYDGNAQSKGGACEVGTAPAMCGNGAERKYGYAPLALLGPDEIDDLATPCINGNAGTMNEQGLMEPQIQMKRVTLGDEDMTIAERIKGVIESNTQKSLSMWHAQGEVSLHCGHKLATEYLEKQLPIAYVVAKSLYDLHFAPRKQRKYALEDVLDFLKGRGMSVGDDAYEAAGISKSLDAGATQRIPNPNQPMHEMVKEKPTSAPNESRVVRPGPKPMFQKPPSTQRAPITPLPNKVGASTTAQTQKIPMVKSLKFPKIKRIG